MPEGSSSEAPVINPGPRIIKSRLRGFRSRSILDSRVSLSGCLLLFAVCLASRTLDSLHSNNVRRLKRKEVGSVLF